MRNNICSIISFHCFQRKQGKNSLPFMKIISEVWRKLLYISSCRFELCCLISNRKCINNLGKISRHNHWKIREICIDTMISNTVLREIISAYLLASISRPDLCKTSSSFCGKLFFFFHCENSRF